MTNSDPGASGTESTNLQSGAPAPSPGDEAPAGTPGTGESICRVCGGSGRDAGGKPCAQCNGTGKVTVGIGGA